jgi:hypothetical protein
MRLGKKMIMTSGPHCRWRSGDGRAAVNLVKQFSGFNLDRDSIVQGTNDKDSKFRVHLGEPLQVQGLK